jgi:hypothetical protein
MQETKRRVRAKSDSINDVEEINGHYVTTREAAQIIGRALNSMSSIVYQGLVEAVRIGGVILIEKESAEQYAAVLREKDLDRDLKRTRKEHEEQQRLQQKELRERLAKMSPEEIEALLAKTEEEG